MWVDLRLRLLFFTDGWQNAICPRLQTPFDKVFVRAEAKRDKTILLKPVCHVKVVAFSSLSVELQMQGQLPEYEARTICSHKRSIVPGTIKALLTVCSHVASKCNQWWAAW